MEGRAEKQGRMVKNCTEGRNTQTAINKTKILNSERKCKEKRNKITRSDPPKTNPRGVDFFY